MHEQGKELGKDVGPSPLQERKILPSSEWRAEERQMVVLAITAEMRGFSRPHATQAEVAFWAQRIYFVLTYPPDFLEINREQILAGLSFPS